MTVKHIATGIKYKKIGLAKRMTFAFGEFMKQHYGVTKIQFHESPAPEKVQIYEYFFEHTLKATKLENNVWEWEIKLAKGHKMP